jgi:O-antigen/teichoic acid export membrane protein
MRGSPFGHAVVETRVPRPNQRSTPKRDAPVEPESELHLVSRKERVVKTVLCSIGWITNRIEALRNDAFRRGDEQITLPGVVLSLLGDSSQYLIGVAAMGLANVLLLPLYTRFLNQSDFGLYALIEVLALSLIAISGLGFPVAYLKCFAASGPGEVSKLLGTMLWVNGLLAAITGAGLSIFLDSPWSAHLLHGDARHFAWLLLPLILLESLQGVLLTHLRARRKAGSFSWASAIRLLCIAALSIWLVAGRGEGLIGVFKARVMGDVLACLLLWGLTASDLSLSASLPSAWSMAKYGLPVMGSALIMMILDGAGRFFLDQYGNLEQVGLYAVGVKISGVMRLLVVVPFGAAWGGLVFQIAKRTRAPMIYSKLMNYLVVLSISVALVLSLFSPLLLHILATREYSGSLVCIPWLLLVQAAAVLQYPSSVGIYLGSATRWLLPIFSCGMIASFLLNRLLIPRFGILGAAWAWLGAWVVITVLMAWVGQRHYRLQYEKKPFLIAFSACVLVLGASRLGLLITRNGGILAPALVSMLILVGAVGYVWDDLRTLDTGTASPVGG